MDWNGERPGGAFAVVQDGEVIYENYFGLANIDKKEAFSEQTITDIGSVSKQFTAACIAILEEMGELALQDDIRKYIPELPIYNDTVRVTHLVHHTSGIKDYEALVRLRNQHYFDDFMTNQYVTDLAISQRSLNFKPGCQYEYSNTNYILMAEIIERVSGKSLNEFASTHIFEPLGMGDTFFNENQSDDFERRAFGYEPNEGGFESPVYRSHLVGDGGVFTTLQDMIKWDQNFLNNKLGSGTSKLTERMKDIETYCDGSVGHYAFAQVYTRLPYGNSWSHGGGGGGYRTFYERFEEDQISFIAMSNSDNSNAFNKVIQTARLFLKSEQNPTSQNQPEVKQPEYLEADDKLIGNFEGYYCDSAEIKVLKIEFDRSLEQFNVVTVDEWKDAFPSALSNSTTLIQTEGGNNQFALESPDTLVHKAGKRLLGTYKKLRRSTRDVSEYVGVYHSEELSHQVELSVKNGQLYADNNYFKNLTLIADDLLVDQDSGAILAFKRNEQGQIISFTIDVRNGDRLARNVGFRKL